MVEDIREFMGLWEEAQKKEVPKESPQKIKEILPKSDAIQELYWSNLYMEMENQAHPNPVAPFSYGKDSEHPNPEWVDNPLLKELEDLKTKLYDLESKMNKKEEGGDKWVEEPVEQEGGESFSSEIENLKKNIDDLSDKITHSFSDKKNPESL